MGVAAAAGDRVPRHPIAIVTGFRHVFPRNRLPEARPAGAGVELGLRAEQRRIAADAAEEAALMQVPCGAAEGTLGAGAARHFVGDRRKLTPPLGVGLDDARDGHLAGFVAMDVKLDDGHAAWSIRRGDLFRRKDRPASQSQVGRATRRRNNQCPPFQILFSSFDRQF